MALPTPSSAAEVDSRAKTDIVRNLVGSNPFLRNSWLGALVTAYANRIFDFYYALTQASKESLPDTAVVNLERLAAIWGIVRAAATKASGNIAVSGTSPGETVLIGTLFTASDGKEYEATQTVPLPIATITPTSITSVGTLCTVTMPTAHGLASTALLTITGCTETEYNVSIPDITVTSATTFTYEADSVPSGSPATGSPLVSHFTANVPVQSKEFGEDQNQVFDAILILQSPIFGVDDECGVDWGAIGGGTDQESDTSLRARLLERIQDPIAHFNANEIIAVAKTVAGVTRVFVHEITPAVGQVTIYFMRDNDDNPIPSGSEITDVETAMETIRPANSDVADVIVSAPVGVDVDFTFTDLQPSTVSMKTAVEANLALFFADRTDVGVNIDADAYRSAIFNTVDTTNGDIVTTFTLSVPAGDITIAAGEIGVLGNVTFP